MTDEQEIRDLTRWAVACHNGDMATVLAHHAPTIVIFDVPPPTAVSAAWMRIATHGQGARLRRGWSPAVPVRPCSAKAVKNSHAAADGVRLAT